MIGIPQLVQLAPGVFLGSYGTLLNRDFLDLSNVKVIVNCGSTKLFLHYIDTQQPVLSSDIIVLNLDPYTLNTDEAFKEFHARFNRILQNYLAFFYNYNEDVKYYINSNFEDAKLTFESPTMNGMPLKLLFNINRLLKLIKNVNTSAGVVFISEFYGQQNLANGLLYALAILYLMDSYSYNFESSYKYLLSILPCTSSDASGVMGFRAPSPQDLFHFSHYDDVLLIDSLKKFYTENCKIKQNELGVMTKNRKLKRSLDSFDTMAPQTCKRIA